MSSEPIEPDPWATFDAALGDLGAPSTTDGVAAGTFAFYGRCSTEDHQDPETSRAWQHGNARSFVEPLGGRIAVEFFDVGHSRSVPWERRPQARRLLGELKNPNRGWSGVIVGEGTRSWFGNQFSLVAPRFAAYGVELWVPELGGRFDPYNPSHKMLMSVLGGMSESERQHVQARVRAAMDAQVLNEGRHQGGRAPYGYVTVDGGPHPHPGKAAEGARLKVLAVDPDTAPVVRRIFAAYLDGEGDRSIAVALNHDAIPCPSASRPNQNRHRLRDGWQASTVRAILDNPRYTGYAVFGRWRKHETLIDPEDVGAGNKTMMRRSDPSTVIRSRRPAHPEIVSVDTFTKAQLLRRSRAAGGLESARKLDRGTTSRSQNTYLLRGRIRCALCGRKMEGSRRGPRTYYRCAARSIAPGSPVLAEHPKNVYFPEAVVMGDINEWIGSLLDSERRAETVDRLTEAGESSDVARQARQARDRLDEASARMKRHHAAIEAGVDPAAIVEPLNRAKKEREAAQAVLDGLPVTHQVDRQEIEELVDRAGEFAVDLERATPGRLAELYQAAGVEMTYDPHADAVDVTVAPGRGVSACVRGGT